MPKTLSVLVPYRLPEPHLEKTLEDIKAKATTNPVILPLEDKSKELRMRHIINEVVEKADTEFIMKLDSHCLLDEGFDEKLIANSKPNRVQVPRRYRLDAEKWEKYGDPIDNEHIIFENLLHKLIWGTPWETDHEDMMHFQGSCWFMPREWFKKCGLLKTEGYGGWADEPEEILFTTLQHKGEVKVNKDTFYAHWHKPKELAYPVNVNKNRTFSYNLWVNENRELFREVVEKFMPLPDWPKEWEKWLD